MGACSCNEVPQQDRADATTLIRLEHDHRDFSDRRIVTATCVPGDTDSWLARLVDGYGAQGEPVVEIEIEEVVELMRRQRIRC